MEIKKRLNAFHNLYLLAKRDNFDVIKWRNLLVGIHKKRNDRHRIKDMCLLFYSLAKGKCSQNLSSLDLTYNFWVSKVDPMSEDKESLGATKHTHKTTKESTDLVKQSTTFTMEELTNLYLEKVCDLLKYMNMQQLAMVSRSLLLLGKFDDSVYNIVLEKLNYGHLSIDPRSLSDIIGTLSEYELTSGDCVEKILLQYMQVLSQMGMIDTVSVLKTLSKYKILNDEILKVVLEKVSYYSHAMNPSDLLQVLYALYKLNHCDKKTLLILYTRTQTLLLSFNCKELISIAKYFSRFNPEYIKDFLDVQLSPLVHRLFQSYKASCKNRDWIDLILLFYVYSVKSGSSSYPKLLPEILSDIFTGKQWDLVFYTLNRYTLNGKTLTYYKDDPDIPENELWVKSIKMFTRWLCNGHRLDSEKIISITANIMDSEVYDEVLFKKILEIVLSDKFYTKETIVKVLYNIHTIPDRKFDEVCTKFLHKFPDLDFTSTILMISILFSRDVFPPKSLLSTLKSTFDSRIVSNQSEEWELPSAVKDVRFKEISINKRILNMMSLRIPQYLFFVISLYNKEYGNTLHNEGEDHAENNPKYLPMNFEMQSQHISKFSDELSSLYALINSRPSRYVRKDLIKVLLYVIKNWNLDVYKRMVDSDYTKVTFEILQSVTPPAELLHKLNSHDKLVKGVNVRVDGTCLFEPIYLVMDGIKTAFVSGEYGINKLDRIKIKLLYALLHLEGYKVVIYNPTN
ncbi:hypothetical protein BEWA_001480 [Theileria equi strain WA]|uniref:RAP domain-containing protein n=1 Tax=Theileria equi strain WA TaxID=1537102 RepID=L0B0F2_THEEQ|nr:hypothetical protein BEWA_001480 [Theileria equi strain WA]AFZ80741.1 hypothetical protein BEWA_001480 [Theileria equi strain WA]|eukprot:XP_004830407.1 hypothetical protein BEWA_001480 [Theileria equi strain WA]